MSREIDVIIFGATGFTGQHCIPVIHKLAKANNRSLTWGIAGRSEQKLKDVLKEYEKELETSFEKIPVIIADVSDDESLRQMARKTRIVINCCGPYRFYGEQVVKACIEEGTHHVDVSGEPQYMENMQLKYNKVAQERGVYIISACGFDSIPTDMGIIFLQEKFGGTLNSVVTYLEGGDDSSKSVGGPAVNFGTWESAVYGLAFANELRELRQKLFPNRLPRFEPKLKVKSLPHKSSFIDGWVLPFLGSDRSVVRRSQRFFYEVEKKRPVQIETFFVVKSFFTVLLLSVYGALFSVLARFNFGRNLLIKYPEMFSNGYFSRNPPSEEKIKNSWFSVTLYGEGWKERLAGPDDVYKTPLDRCMTVKVKGKNPGYGATCIALILSGIMVITEADKMPAKGGVYPPGAAFAKTSLIQQLNENGVTFEVLAEKDL